MEIGVDAPRRSQPQVESNSADNSAGAGKASASEVAGGKKAKLSRQKLAGDPAVQKAMEMLDATIVDVRE